MFISLKADYFQLWFLYKSDMRINSNSYNFATWLCNSFAFQILI